MNQLSLEEAYAKWSDELVGYATAIAAAEVADDIVAEAFAGLIRRERDDAEAQRSSGWAALDDPRPYLFRVVFNTAAMHRRTEHRRTGRERRSALQAVPTAPTSTWPPPATSLLGDPAVRAAVDALSPQQRGAVYLTYWLDFDARQVADSLGCSSGSVKRHLARARASLRIALNRKVTS